MGCGCKKNKDGIKAPAVINPQKGFVIADTSDGLKEQHPLPGPKQPGFTINLEERLTPTPVVNTKEPSLLKKALSLGEAVVNHVADGLTKTTKEELALRLSICESCHHRNGESCGLCGCLISTKSSWKSSTCPDDRWPTLDTKEK